MSHPIVRTKELLIQQMESEILVFDQERNVLHTLNPTAALVFQHADGTRSRAALAALLQAQLNEKADEDLVEVTLDHLRRAHLLEEVEPRSTEAIRASRRRFVRKVGMVGTLTLLFPVVETIVAPTPSMAQSGDPCGSGSS